jgi:hypothetical protein
MSQTNTEESAGIRGARGLGQSFPNPKRVTNPYPSGERRGPEWVKLEVPDHYPNPIGERRLHSRERAIAEQVYDRDVWTYQNRLNPNLLWMLKHSPDPRSRDLEYQEDCHDRWRRWGHLLHIRPCPISPEDFLSPEEREQRRAEAELEKKHRPIREEIGKIETTLGNLRNELAILDQVEDALNDAHLNHAIDRLDPVKEHEFLMLSAKASRKQKFMPVLTSRIKEAEKQIDALRQQERELLQKTN